MATKRSRDNPVRKEGVSGILNFCWKLFEWIRNRYEKTFMELGY